MSWFLCRVTGENFPLKIDGVPHLLGFYADVYVEAEGNEEAEGDAISLLRGDSRLAFSSEMIQNDRPPRVFVDEIVSVDEKDVPEVRRGFTFFDMPQFE